MSKREENYWVVALHTHMFAHDWWFGVGPKKDLNIQKLSCNYFLESSVSNIINNLR